MIRATLWLAVATLGGCATVASGPHAGTADIASAILTYDWTAGSVAPPNHTQLEIAIAPDGAARVTFWPDYPGRAPAEQRDYRVASDKMTALRQTVADALVGETAVRAADAPAPGSGTEQIVVARGERITTVQVGAPREQAARAAPAVAAFRATVPEEFWAEFDRLTPARDYRGGM